MPGTGSSLVVVPRVDDRRRGIEPRADPDARGSERWKLSPAMMVKLDSDVQELQESPRRLTRRDQASYRRDLDVPPADLLENLLARNDSQVPTPSACSGVRFAPARNAAEARPGVRRFTMSRRLPVAAR